VLFRSDTIDNFIMREAEEAFENFLGVLARVVDQYGGRELDQQASEALDTALNYIPPGGAPAHRRRRRVALPEDA